MQIKIFINTFFSQMFGILVTDAIQTYYLKEKWVFVR